ncbi:hypothetical protein SS50377_23319 [Spironucleus salmonicida]|uniref:Uncharacterized protein n=1 Tax=Spironucleus salmonicida TaxID=348837 RepID=V6LSI4_9EUKA|nr:hypothetical protein SS50377_23319 [Spironucleus salmonicida]|eukprot:EST47188.1 Hypothetical protein SS50377_12699 [Spironucleus salmonicida]
METQIACKPSKPLSVTFCNVKLSNGRQTTEFPEKYSTRQVFMNMLKQDEQVEDDSVFSLIKGFQKACVKNQDPPKSIISRLQIQDKAFIQSGIVQNIVPTSKVVKQLNFKSMEQSQYRLIFVQAIKAGRQVFFNRLQNLFKSEKLQLSQQATIEIQDINQISYISKLSKSESIIKSYTTYKKDQSIRTIQRQQQEIETLFGDCEFLSYISFIKWQKDIKNNFYINPSLVLPTTVVLDMINQVIQFIKIQ